VSSRGMDIDGECHAEDGPPRRRKALFSVLNSGTRAKEANLGVQWKETGRR